MGATLLDRQGRSVVPTKVGEMLYRRATGLLKETRHVELEVEAFMGRWKGTVRIGGSTVSGNHILPGLLAEFRRAYPEAAVEMTVGDSDRISTLVSFGTLELGFVSALQANSTLEATPLWVDELVLVAPPSHRWCGPGSVGLRALATEPMIIREPSSGTRQTLAVGLEEVWEGGVDALDIAAVLGSSEAIKEGVIGGLGVAFLSARAVQRELEAGLLSVVAVEGLEVDRCIHVVADPRSSKSPLCQAMMDFVLARIQD